jgi:DNA polymerase III alpha subunit
MLRPGFTHLETHSSYTLLGSTVPVAALAARAASEGMSHLALTDTNALYGAVTFNRACLAAGVQPIIGMTLSVASEEPDAPAGQLVLLATGPPVTAPCAGFLPLYRLLLSGELLASQGLGWGALAQQRAGLICLSGRRCAG